MNFLLLSVITSTWGGIVVQKLLEGFFWLIIIIETSYRIERFLNVFRNGIGYVDGSTETVGGFLLIDYHYRNKLSYRTMS